MATMRLVELLCDGGEDCEAGGELGQRLDSGERSLREDARRAGWRCDDSGDWCEEHRVAGEAPPPPFSSPDHG